MGSASGEFSPSAAGRLWPARRMVVTVHESGGAETTISVDKPFARVGRDRRAEVHVNGPSVLPCQLYLHATDDGIYCLSLSADASSGWLTAGSKVRVGDHRISVAFADGPPARPGNADLCARHGAMQPVPLITVAAGRQQIAIRDVAVHRQLTLIGRQPPGTLCVRHRTISRAHCVLFWDGRQLWLIDLLSSNGTRLDGERFDAGPVPKGGTVRLGDIRFHFATTVPLEQDRLHSDSGSGLLDVPSDSDLLPGVPADASHVAEAVHSAELEARRTHATESGQPRRSKSEWDARLREWAEQLRQQRSQTEDMLAAREAAETQHAQKIEQLEKALADALIAARSHREMAVGEAADREAMLAAMREALTSLEEKLARTEAKLAAAPVEAANGGQATAILEERLQSLADQLARQQQEQVEARSAFEKQRAAHYAAETQQAQQLALVEAKLADALLAAQEERELLLGDAADREATLAAMRASLALLEEKLARTEAKLAAASVEPADGAPATAILEERLQSLAEQLAQQQQEQVEARSAFEKQRTAHDAAETQRSKQLALVETKLADALRTAQQERELLLGDVADRESTLAAMRRSLTSLEEKLARTEAKLAAAPAEATSGAQATAMLEERLQSLAEQLVQQRQQQSEARTELEKQRSAWDQRFQDYEARLTRQGEAFAECDAAPIGRETTDIAPTRESLTALEERLAPLEAKLATLAEQVSSPTRQVVARDTSATASGGEWMLDDEHTRRLLAFRHKRESKRRWRQLAWAAAGSLVVAVGAVITGVVIHHTKESAANRPPATGSEATPAGFVP